MPESLPLSMCLGIFKFCFKNFDVSLTNKQFQFNVIQNEFRNQKQQIFCISNIVTPFYNTKGEKHSYCFQHFSANAKKVQE